MFNRRDKKLRKELEKKFPEMKRVSIETLMRIIKIVYKKSKNSHYRVPHAG